MAPRNPTPEQIDDFGRSVMFSANFSGAKTKTLKYRLGLRRWATNHLWGVDIIAQGDSRSYSVWQRSGGLCRFFNVSLPAGLPKNWELVQDGITGSLQTSSSSVNCERDPITKKKILGKKPRSMCATITAIEAVSNRFPWWNQNEALPQTELKITDFGTTHTGVKWLEFYAPDFSRARRHQEPVITARADGKVIKNDTLFDASEEVEEDLKSQEEVPVQRVPTVQERVATMREHYDWFLNQGMAVEIKNGALTVVL